MKFSEAAEALFKRNGWDEGSDESRITLKRGDLRRVLEQFYKPGVDGERSFAKSMGDILRKAEAFR